MGKQLLRGAMALAMVTAAAPASGALVEWTFSGIFSDGATANGSFRYDTNTMMFSDFGISYSGGPNYPAASFTVFDALFSDPDLFSLYPDGTNAGQDLSGAINLYVFPITSFGDLNQLSGNLGGGDIATCADFPCQFIDPPIVSIAEGTLTGVIVSVSAPPTVFGLALAGLGVTAWRRRKAA